eukprot:TRINITY_DN440_c0_g2_i1.p1 TRINITY_DN440_c0_g2~~TRINITY_DN440_c0_g2_i1.p1  ORF type:complete len:106 (+),score=8.21 TRINITY_DN440_c0_g2_i1:104-421(+)
MGINLKTGKMPKGKGTQSMGKRHTPVFSLCRRCGKMSYHTKHKRCAACGYPDTKIRRYNWSPKVRRRTGQGTGRMRYLRHIPRLAKNGFRSGTVAKPRNRKAASK